ncbi:hypothetical protein GCM10022409_45110 [Hymenobacter glaciei]|uniref:Resolvase/invertase-type recombinase catalytic domain-containing protein n=1 Tax=Hymenobacter glaciei TaxID=877209 RepID=A0ABP7UU94_9BACT
MRVAIYARVSTKDKGQSTENQVPDLVRYAGALGHSIYKEYVEEESGGTGERSQFKAMFADAHRRKFDMVLFWSLDRFSREGALPTLQYLNQLESWGVGYKSFTEQYLDSTGLFKDAIVSILATLAKQERVRLSERTKAGMARKVSQGVKMGPPTKSQAEIEQIRRLEGGGMSNYAIGKAMKMSASTVAKYLE